MNAVGHAWTEEEKKGKLFGTVHVAADVFYSLIPCLATNHFRELHVKVLTLRHKEGSIDQFSLAQERLSEKFPD